MSTAKTGGRALIDWCKHILFEDGKYFRWVPDGHAPCPSYWKFCPICGKPRPKTGGIER